MALRRGVPKPSALAVERVVASMCPVAPWWLHRYHWAEVAVHDGADVHAEVGPESRGTLERELDALLTSSSESTTLEWGVAGEEIPTASGVPCFSPFDPLRQGSTPCTLSGGRRRRTPWMWRVAPASTTVNSTKGSIGSWRARGNTPTCTPSAAFEADRSRFGTSQVSRIWVHRGWGRCARGDAGATSASIRGSSQEAAGSDRGAARCQEEAPASGETGSARSLVCQEDASASGEAGKDATSASGEAGNAQGGGVPDLSGLGSTRQMLDEAWD